MTRLFTSLIVLTSVLSVSSLPGAGYRFLLPTIDVLPGASARFTIEGEYEQAAQGFTIAAHYPASDLTIERMHIEDTILEALNGLEGVDFFDTRIAPLEGIFTVGVLVDSKPPFDGTLIPAIGRPLDFIHLEVKVSEAARGDLKIRLANGLLSPPIDNLYSVDNNAVYVTELTTGTIHVAGDPGEGAGFLRGDFNMDATIDISDPIGILGFSFYGWSSPHCAVAADANDDEEVDLSDPIYLLLYLFAHGPPPPPPFSTLGGTDPTPGDLSCALPMN